MKAETSKEATPSQSETTDEIPVECKPNVPIETESSQTEAQKCPVQPCSSRTADERSYTLEDEQNGGEDSPCTSMENKQEGHMMENLQQRLTKMRDGFLEKYDVKSIRSLLHLLY